jgi:HEAT repeat protein
MPKRDVPKELERLSALRSLADREALADELRRALGDPVNVIVARAAKLAGELELDSLIPDLLKHFDRLFIDPVKKDPQCWGKNALAKALKDLKHEESVLFLRGARHVQMEPVWGGEEDTAPTLRGACAMALVQCRDITRDDTFRVLVETVSDRIATVRSDAVHALQQMAGIEASLLLRLKGRVGDKEPHITGEVLEAILALEGVGGLDFVAAFLTHRDEEVQDEAALALGASRLPEAVEILIQRWKSRPVLTLLRAIGISRGQRAVDFLLDVVRAGREQAARAALEALELYRSDDAMAGIIDQAARESGLLG